MADSLSETNDREVALGWGAEPLRVFIPWSASVFWPPEAPPARSWAEVCAEALGSPIGAPPLSERLRGLRRVCVLVPDQTRKDVATGLLPHILPLLSGLEVTVVVAAGKHPPSMPPGLDALDGFGVRIRVHDASADDLVEVGRTPAGTPVAYPRDVLGADLRILLGELRPHYFAGYAGGAKGLFPGVAGAAGIWQNHRLKAAPGARLGVVEGNPCRADLEAAAALAGPSFLLNVARGAHGGPVFAVSGDPVLAHRAGVSRAAALFEVSVDPGEGFDTVLVSDANPVSASLYQGAKLLAPAGALLRDGGTVILAIECGEGIGPIDTINDSIYRLGLVHSLPPRHRVLMVTSRSEAAVAPTFATYMPSVAAALREAGPGRLAVLPQAGDLIIRRTVSAP